MGFLDWIGAISGLLGVWLTMRKNLWCFPVGLINVFISCYLFFQSHLYADTLQQLVFAILIIYGWISWQTESSVQSKPISILSDASRFGYSILAISIGICLGALLDKFTNAHFPFLDSLLTSFCFLGQYLIAKRKIENWHIWIFTNAGYVILYVVKDLSVYAFLYSVYLAMAFGGLKQWQIELSHGK